MSNSSENNNLEDYLSTISCYKDLEALYSQGKAKEYGSLLTQVNQCHVQMDKLLNSEKEEFFAEHLLKLKSQLECFTLTLESKIINVLTANTGKTKGNDSISITRVCVKKNNEGGREIAEKKRKIDDKDKKQTHAFRNIEEIPTVKSLNQIIGLREVKKILKSMIILPKTQPQLFANKQLCNTILLYGPPGTGKTRIVHAVASEANAKLYLLSGSNILSPYVGQTEETIQAIFKHIRTSSHYSLLFIDEIDGLCRKRTTNEQEYSRRIKTELMGHLSRIEDCRNLFVICATNCPWDLDSAILRRFQRRIYVPLPNSSERLEFFRSFTEGTSFEYSVDMWNAIVEKTDGYSGSDLSSVMKCAMNAPIAELEETKIWKQCSDGFYQPICHEDDIDNIVCCELDELPANSVRARTLEISDILSAAEQVTSTVSKEEVFKFQAFNTKF